MSAMKDRLVQVAVDLEAAGWPSVADDVLEMVSLETLLARLHSMGEGESEAAEIVAAATVH